MTTTARGYLKIDENGNALFFPPCGARWTGGSVEAHHTYKGMAPGWYRCVATWDGSHRPFVDVGRKVDPIVEAARLEGLASKSGHARTRHSGIAGYQHMENMANAALAGRRYTQRHFARVLRSDGAEA